MKRIPAAFYDGVTAARHEVRATLANSGIRIHDSGDSELAFWSYEGLIGLGEVFEGDSLHLAHGDQEGARLVFPDDALLPYIAARAPQLDKPRRDWDERLLRWAGMTALAAAVLAGVLVYGLPAAASFVTRFVPISWEVALGEKMIDQVVELFGYFDEDGDLAFCDGVEGSKVLDDLSRRLAEAADSPYQFNVQVLDHEMLNAFALPGGQIVIMKGLLEFAKSPDEVVGVLAHEFGHVTERHVTERIIESAGLAFFFGVMLGDIGSGAAALASEQIIDMSFSRELEAEADREALVLLERSGLTAEGLISFFDRLKGMDLGENSALQLLSTHPTSRSRAEQIRNSAAPGEVSMDLQDWYALKYICSDGESPHP